MVPRIPPAPGDSRAPRRRARRARPEVAPLEGRALMAILSLAAGASPTRLVRIQPGQLQKNTVERGSQVQEVISGQVITDSLTAPKVTFQVFDEFHHEQPRGTIKAIFPYINRTGPGVIYPFMTRIALNLRHPLSDPDGRQYDIRITAQDQNSVQTQDVVVTVPRVNFFFGPVRHQIRVL
jgi:hypothetical protein